MMTPILLPAVLALAFILSSCDRKDQSASGKAQEGESADVRTAREDFMARRDAEQHEQDDILAKIGGHCRASLPHRDETGGGIRGELLKRYQWDLHCIQGETESFFRRRNEQWTHLFHDWEEKKWAGYTPPVLKTPRYAKFEDGWISHGIIPLPDCPTPAVTSARLDFLAHQLAKALLRADDLEARRAEEESPSRLADRRSLAVREDELREKMARAPNGTERQARFDELMILLKKKRPSWGEQRSSLVWGYRGEWSDWEAKSWDGYKFQRASGTTDRDDGKIFPKAAPAREDHPPR